MSTNDAAVETYDLCIIGAGIAGMNALVVASTYLPKTAKVLLVDTRPRVGGMWVDTYDYVRLHQPHGNFTAGNISWKLDEAPNHLASKGEVLDHFQRCFGIAAERMNIETEFGTAYVSHRESGDLVEITLTTPGGQSKTVSAERLIKAIGHHVTPNEPLAVASANVRSITPELLREHDAALRADDTPIWVIGGGKTAADAAYRLITEFPGREVNMLAGPGTIFTRREPFFPNGARRWWSGKSINSMVRQTSRMFDGTNEDEVRDWFLGAYGLGIAEESRDYFGAYLSEGEADVIKNGLATVENEYFADAVDRGGRTELVLRSGGVREVKPETWLVNCTGSLLREELRPYEELISPSGRVLAIQLRSSATGVFTSFSGYFMTHLMFTDKLRTADIYVLDVEELFSKARPLAIYASFSCSMHNLSVISKALPNKVLLDCGLDYDRWYPFPRRMIFTMDFLRTHSRDRKHHRKTLDTVCERFGVRGGMINA
ncbi:hypothetical protein J2X11_001023 [Aeromicrobium panaciterrae]|uniref:FAD/NAD(P)-binding domain-containing protein n=1 Tax=Aeromicrobium panaciterrae TaxID=363861 RepID=A0ABU1ULX4_9ACTN|nr:FAD-dependent oxidoreductase [Aeromicrobium panaciterrae]MDR7086184.1 hypothetical protein [Aeromicrobium panaciterrae]